MFLLEDMPEIYSPPPKSRSRRASPNFKKEKKEEVLEKVNALLNSKKKERGQDFLIAKKPTKPQPIKISNEADSDNEKASPNPSPSTFKNSPNLPPIESDESPSAHNQSINKSAEKSVKAELDKSVEASVKEESVHSAEKLIPKEPTEENKELSEIQSSRKDSLEEEAPPSLPLQRQFTMTDENGNLVEFTAEQLAELADASLDALSEADLQILKR